MPPFLITLSLFAGCSQDGQVRHIRVINEGKGFCIKSVGILFIFVARLDPPLTRAFGGIRSKADPPCETIAALIREKQGEKIKSKLAGGVTQETVLLREPLCGAPRPHGRAGGIYTHTGPLRSAGR